MKQAGLVLAYLAAIVAANILVAMFGPGVSVINAFLFIGFDLVSRDALHAAWMNKHLPLRMGLLIATGGAISYLLNSASASIAIASTVAFSASATGDAIVYHLLRRRSWRQRANGSNIVGAAIDSVVFPTLAFGGLLPGIVLAQFAAKTIGGAVWAAVISRVAVANDLAPADA